MGLKQVKSLFQVSTIPYFSGGDTEVNTRPGRTTQVKLKVDNIRISNDKRNVLVGVDFHIIEVASNHTHLRFLGEHRIPLPNSWKHKNVKIGGEARGLNLTQSIAGKQHNWIDIAIDDEETVVEDAMIKIDGPGNNDDENAELELIFKIPIVVT
ncbi:MAG: hypothetical protein ACKVUS_20555 [Saprospiraceae bacterium]